MKDKKQIVLRSTVNERLNDKQAINEAKFLLSDNVNKVMQSDILGLIAIQEMAKDGHEGYIKISDASCVRLFKIEDIAQAILDDLDKIRDNTCKILDKIENEEDISEDDIERIMKNIVKELELE